MAIELDSLSRCQHTVLRAVHQARLSLTICTRLQFISNLWVFRQTVKKAGYDLIGQKYKYNNVCNLAGSTKTCFCRSEERKFSFIDCGSGKVMTDFHESFQND